MDQLHHWQHLAEESSRERDAALKRAEKAEADLAALGPLIDRLEAIADAAEARANEQTAVIAQLRRQLAERRGGHEPRCSAPAP